MSRISIVDEKYNNFLFSANDKNIKLIKNYMRNSPQPVRTFVYVISTIGNTVNLLSLFYNPSITSKFFNDNDEEILTNSTLNLENIDVSNLYLARFSITLSSIPNYIQTGFIFSMSTTQNKLIYTENEELPFDRNNDSFGFGTTNGNQNWTLYSPSGNKNFTDISTKVINNTAVPQFFNITNISKDENKTTFNVSDQLSDIHNQILLVYQNTPIIPSIVSGFVHETLPSNQLTLTSFFYSPNTNDTLTFYDNDNMALPQTYQIQSVDETIETSYRYTRTIRVTILNEFENINGYRFSFVPNDEAQPIERRYDINPIPTAYGFGNLNEGWVFSNYGTPLINGDNVVFVYNHNETLIMITNSINNLNSAGSYNLVTFNSELLNSLQVNKVFYFRE